MGPCFDCRITHQIDAKSVCCSLLSFQSQFELDASQLTQCDIQFITLLSGRKPMSGLNPIILYNKQNWEFGGEM